LTEEHSPEADAETRDPENGFFALIAAI